MTRMLRTREVREMRNADTVLGIIRDRGSARTAAGGCLSTTVQPGPLPARLREHLPQRRCHDARRTAETVDGMSLEKIAGHHRGRSATSGIGGRRCAASTSRRSTRRRSGRSGIPTWSDKLLQEVIRLILEAYYEPQFSRPLPWLPARTRVPHRA